MTEGTRSLLLGSHHWLFHPLAIIRAWRAVYGKWPAPWQLVCIFLHDVGLIGMQYLSGPKTGHWKRGAMIAQILCGEKGFLLCAGHSRTSRYKESRLFLVDKLNTLYRPRWELEIVHRVEGFGTKYGWSIDRWLASVRQRATEGFREDSHAVFLNGKRTRGER